VVDECRRYGVGDVPPMHQNLVTEERGDGDHVNLKIGMEVTDGVGANLERFSLSTTPPPRPTGRRGREGGPRSPRPCSPRSRSEGHPWRRLAQPVSTRRYSRAVPIT
jgi:hypothetical protein